MIKNDNKIFLVALLGLVLTVIAATFAPDLFWFWWTW